ncbi:hypothetical protein DENSPDRAFT_931527, partial [Dentipellis sp. KUC8613]
MRRTRPPHFARDRPAWYPGAYLHSYSKQSQAPHYCSCPYSSSTVPPPPFQAGIAPHGCRQSAPPTMSNPNWSPPVLTG